MTSPRIDMPLTLRRGRALAHRLALAPLTNFQSNDDGTLAEDEFVWLTSRARGGFALTMTCAAFVSPEGKGFPGQLGICSPIHEAGLARLADGLREAGTVSSVQLQHSGMRASSAATGLAPVCPWEDAQTGAQALSTGDVKRIIDDFVTAAVRAQRAGFEGVELHAAHGYLLGQFLDGQNNGRDDGYGGSLEDRSRILRQIIDGVRASTSAEFQLGVRLSPERWGIQIAESLQLAAQLLESEQLDYLDMSLWDCFKPCKEEAYAGRPLIDLFAALPRGQTRLGVAGKILSSATAQACLDHGADFVMIGRAAILHQDFVSRALADPGFAAMPRPVSRAWLASQFVGPRFIHYLATEWPDFVIKE